MTKDSKQMEQFIDKLTKAMEHDNEHGNHPILHSCVFVPFGKSAAIDQSSLLQLILILMQNEFLRSTSTINA
jgi:hypothetical protein